MAVAVALYVGWVAYLLLKTSKDGLGGGAESTESAEEEETAIEADSPYVELTGFEDNQTFLNQNYYQDESRGVDTFWSSGGTHVLCKFHTTGLSSRWKWGIQPAGNYNESKDAWNALCTSEDFEVAETWHVSEGKNPWQMAPKARATAHGLQGNTDAEEMPFLMLLVAPLAALSPCVAICWLSICCCCPTLREEEEEHLASASHGGDAAAALPGFPKAMQLGQSAAGGAERQGGGAAEDSGHQPRAGSADVDGSARGERPRSGDGSARMSGGGESAARRRSSKRKDRRRRAAEEEGGDSDDSLDVIFSSRRSFEEEQQQRLDEKRRRKEAQQEKRRRKEPKADKEEDASDVQSSAWSAGGAPCTRAAAVAASLAAPAPEPQQQGATVEEAACGAEQAEDYFDGWGYALVVAGCPSEALDADTAYEDSFGELEECAFADLFHPPMEIQQEEEEYDEEDASQWQVHP